MEVVIVIHPPDWFHEFDVGHRILAVFTSVLGAEAAVRKRVTARAAQMLAASATGNRNAWIEEQCKRFAYEVIEVEDN